MLVMSPTVELIGAAKRVETLLPWWRNFPEEIMLDGVLPDLVELASKAYEKRRDLAQFATYTPDGDLRVGGIMWASAARWLYRLPLIGGMEHDEGSLVRVYTNQKDSELPVTLLREALMGSVGDLLVYMNFVNLEEIDVRLLATTGQSSQLVRTMPVSGLDTMIAQAYQFTDDHTPLRMTPGGLAHLGLASYVWEGINGDKSLSALGTDWPDMRMTLDPMMHS